MAVDLVNLVSRILTPQLVGGLARAVGVNEAVAQKLVASAIPTVLASLITMASAPGGAQKLADAVANSDPDLLTKLSAAISGGNVGALDQGANLLGGLLGGSGLSNLAGALSQYASAPTGAAQSAIGAVAQAAVGAIGQQDPSNWSDRSSIAAMLSEQKTAISAALPAEVSRALSATGLLAGLGSLSAAARPARPAPAPAGAASGPTAAPPPATPSRGGFPMWAIVLLIVIVLVAVWWFVSQNQRPEPVKQGMLDAPIGFVLTALPGQRARAESVASIFIARVSS